MKNKLESEALLGEEEESNEVILSKDLIESDGTGKKKRDVLGKKTIHMFASIVLNMNNITGPGMLAVPLIYQQAGYVVPTLLLVFTCILASLGSTCICEAMALMPGNRKFDRRVEFATVIKHYFGKKAYIAGQIFFNLNLLSLNISSMIATAQVADEMLVAIFKHSYGIQFIPSVKVIVANADYKTTPFGDAGFLVVTLGYIVVLALCLPMGFLNLDENIIFQYVSFVVTLGIIAEFIWAFASRGITLENIPVATTNVGKVFGVIMFSYAFVVTIPSWVNEKTPRVSVNKATWISTIACSVLYLLVGLFGAWAYKDVSGNILLFIAKPPTGKAPIITKISVYIFAFGVIGLGIPLYSVMVRYNLYVGGVFGKGLSAFCGVVLPWIIAIIFYQGNGFTMFVNWSSLTVGSVINFIVPFWLYIRARDWHAKGIAGYTAHEKDIPDDDDYSGSDKMFYGSINTLPREMKELSETEQKKKDNIHYALPYSWKVWGSHIIPHVLWIVTSILVVITIVLEIIALAKHKKTN